MNVLAGVTRRRIVKLPGGSWASSAAPVRLRRRDNDGEIWVDSASGVLESSRRSKSSSDSDGNLYGSGTSRDALNRATLEQCSFSTRNIVQMPLLVISEHPTRKETKVLCWRSRV